MRGIALQSSGFSAFPAPTGRKVMSLRPKPFGEQPPSPARKYSWPSLDECGALAASRSIVLAKTRNLWSRLFLFDKHARLGSKKGKWVIAPLRSIGRSSQMFANILDIQFGVSRLLLSDFAALSIHTASLYHNGWINTKKLLNDHIHVNMHTYVVTTQLQVM